MSSPAASLAATSAAAPAIHVAPPRRLPLGAVVSLLCLAIGGIETAQSYAGAQIRGLEDAWWNTVVFSWLPWIPAALLAPAVVWCAGRWPLDRGRWREGLAAHLAAMLAFVLVHDAAAAVTVMPWMGTASGLMVFVKQMSFRSVIDALVYWAIVGGVHAVRATREAREREQAAARLQAGLAEARLAALRAQLDPHFLFNTLNAVSALALRGDGERVVQALATLSDLLRATLGGSPTEEVTLADDLALVDRYLDIQRLRFSDRLTVARDVADDATAAAVPAMLLQPLVENAVQHGVAARPGPTTITIRARRDGDRLRVEVRDGGPGFPAAAAREGIGLANTRARLAELYGDRQSLDCRNEPGAGAVVAVTLPFRPIVARPA